MRQRQTLDGRAANVFGRSAMMKEAYLDVPAAPFAGAGVVEAALAAACFFFAE
jgi:hypothetical protein